MIIELSQNDVGKYWPEIRAKVTDALLGEYPDVDSMMGDIMQRLQTGALKAWIGYKDGDLSRVEYIALTAEIIDAGIGKKDLLIYALAGWHPVADDRWDEDFKILCRYARSMGCNRIVAETREQRLIDLSAKFGCRTDKRKIEFPLDVVELMTAS